MNAPLVRPASACGIWLTSASALLMIGVLLWMTSTGFDTMTVLVACLLAMAVPIGVVDVVGIRRQGALVDDILHRRRQGLRLRLSFGRRLGTLA